MSLTATLTRVDVPERLSETALMRAYSRSNPRTEACACGGWPISVADESDPAEVARAVDVHAQSTAHQLWRNRQSEAI